MAEPALLEVGRIDRAHGLRGEVVVSLVTNRVERLDAGAVLEAECRMLEVAASRPHKHRWIVSFVGIGDRTAAEGLVGAVLRAEPIDDPDALWVHELIGCEVVDVDGVLRGRVEAVEQNPASDLLVLDSGALVPLRFLVDGPAARRLVVDVPTGLFDV